MIYLGFHLRATFYWMFCPPSFVTVFNFNFYLALKSTSPQILLLINTIILISCQHVKTFTNMNFYESAYKLISWLCKLKLFIFTFIIWNSQVQILEIRRLAIGLLVISLHRYLWLKKIGFLRVRLFYHKFHIGLVFGVRFLRLRFLAS